MEHTQIGSPTSMLPNPSASNPHKVSLCFSPQSNHHTTSGSSFQLYCLFFPPQLNFNLARYPFQCPRLRKQPTFLFPEVSLPKSFLLLGEHLSDQRHSIYHAPPPILRPSIMRTCLHAHLSYQPVTAHKNRSYLTPHLCSQVEAKLRDNQHTRRQTPQRLNKEDAPQPRGPGNFVHNFVQNLAHSIFFDPFPDVHRKARDSGSGLPVRHI
ncbi:hypothetical protein BDQ17DRAFT_246514 [Cyathus striatus]|nr:hypothetical protein BDQ17DRAFT_246514 [Cyathus striatus]